MLFAIAAAALVLVGSVNGEACTAAQQSAAFTSMMGLLQSTAFSTCSSESSFSLMDAKSLPSAEQIAAMCKVDACHELIKSVKTANPPDCDLSIPTSGAVMNIKTLADNFEPSCSSLTTAEAPVTTDIATASPTEAAATPATLSEESAPTVAVHPSC
ncbi:unnamed protein product [Phytophthora lilii]|uniref:Elicitin n=1 Tax=Phytophthora lilii TaxID=2077276 RepID=A0A9W6TW13_9STRA|nr:unnamed protein product [Phytophthora lilii]